MKWVCLASMFAATLLAVGVWRVGAPVEPEFFPWWTFAASLLLLVVIVVSVWWRHVRPSRLNVRTLIEGVPPVASWFVVVVFLAAVGFYAMASQQHKPPSTGQLEVVNGRYFRNNHGERTPTTREDYERSVVEAQREYMVGAVATCAVAFFVAAAGHAPRRRSRFVTP